MADFQVRGPVGNVADPQTGVATICGADITTNQGSDDTGDGSTATPFLTIDGSFISPGAGDTVYNAGRVRQAGAFRDFCLGLDGIDGDQGAVNVGQWSGQPQAVITGFFLPGGTLANNKTVSADYWIADGNGWKIVLDGAIGTTKPDLSGTSSPSGNAIDVSRVCFDRDLAAKIDSTTGLRKSNYKVAANAAAVTGGSKTAQGAFFFDTAAVTLYVRFPTGTDDPSTALANGISIALKFKTALYYSSVGGVFTHKNSYIRNVILDGWGDVASAAPFGTAVNISFSENCGCENGTSIDGGDHHIAFGTKVINATVRNWTFIGGEAGCIYLVFNASGSGNTASGTISSSTIYAAPLLGDDGLTINGATGSVGVYVHGLHNGVNINDVTMHVYDPPSGNASAFLPIDSDNGVAPSDPTRATNYPVVVRRLVVNKSTEWYNVGVTSYIGFLNSAVYGSQANEAYASGMLACNSRKGCWMWEGSGLTANLANPNGAASIAMVDVGAAFTIRLLNVTLRDTATSHSNNKIAFFNRRVTTRTINSIGTGASPLIKTTAAHGYIVGTNAVISGTNSTPVIDGVFKVASISESNPGVSGYDQFTIVAVAGGTASVPTVTVAGTTGSVGGYGNIIARGCLFSFDGAGQASRTFRAVNGDAACPIGVDIQDCAFWGVTTDEWSENTAFNSDAEWAAAMAGTVVLAADPFAGVAVGSLEPTTAAKAVRKVLATHTVAGFNSRSYSGQYGGWQAGGGGGPLLNRPRRAVRAVR